MVRNPSEDFFKAFQKHLESLGEEPENDEAMNEILQQFTKDYKAGLADALPLTEKTAQTSEDYLELAEGASSKRKALKYLAKACELDDRNIDAAMQFLELDAKNEQEYKVRLKELLEKARRQMEEDGFFTDECIGDFWGMIETRPFMRVYSAYLSSLMESGKLRLAVEAGRDMLRLCENDNMGIRYALMNCYAALEDVDGAEALLKQFEDDESTMFFLPMSFLYYRVGQEDKAQEMLEKLMEVNRDTKKFFAAMTTKRVPKSNASPYGYRLGTMDEYLECLKERPETYIGCADFWFWAKPIVKGMKSTKMDK